MIEMPKMGSMHVIASKEGIIKDERLTQRLVDKQGRPKNMRLIRDLVMEELLGWNTDPEIKVWVKDPTPRRPKIK